MRTKTPPTNIYFIAKSHTLGAQAGGGGQTKYINLCVSECTQQVGELLIIVVVYTLSFLTG